MNNMAKDVGKSFVIGSVTGIGYGLFCALVMWGVEAIKEKAEEKKAAKAVEDEE
jgi:hypothetical protein